MASPKVHLLRLDSMRCFASIPYRLATDSIRHFVSIPCTALLMAAFCILVDLLLPFLNGSFKMPRIKAFERKAKNR